MAVSVIATLLNPAAAQPYLKSADDVVRHYERTATHLDEMAVQTIASENRILTAFDAENRPPRTLTVDTTVTTHRGRIRIEEESTPSQSLRTRKVLCYDGKDTRMYAESLNPVSGKVLRDGQMARGAKALWIDGFKAIDAYSTATFGCGQFEPAGETSSVLALASGPNHVVQFLSSFGYMLAGETSLARGVSIATNYTEPVKFQGYHLPSRIETIQYNDRRAYLIERSCHVEYKLLNPDQLDGLFDLAFPEGVKVIDVVLTESRRGRHGSSGQ